MHHQGTPVLTTDRLILRPFTVEDAQAMYDNWSSDEETTRYLSWHSHTSVAQTREYLAMRQAQYENDSYYGFCIVWKETGEPIGDISVVGLDEATASAEIGWVLSRAYWGRGIAPEAGRRVIDFLLDQVGCHRVWAYHDGRNPKSGRALSKCGMRYEGTQRQSGLNRDGQCIDRVLYSILATDKRRKDDIAK